MFLKRAHHFYGDPVALAAAHDGLYRRFPPESLDLHVCVLVEGGIAVFDAPKYGDAVNGWACEHALARTVRDSAVLLDSTAGPALVALAGGHQRDPPQ